MDKDEVMSEVLPKPMDDEEWRWFVIITTLICAALIGVAAIIEIMF